MKGIEFDCENLEGQRLYRFCNAVQMVWTNRGVSSDGGDLCKLHEDDEITTPPPFWHGKCLRIMSHWELQIFQKDHSGESGKGDWRGESLEAEGTLQVALLGDGVKEDVVEVGGR